MTIERQMETLKNDMAKQRKIAGDAELVCSSSHGVPQYFVNGEYVSKKNLSRVRAIAQLDYDERVLGELDRKLKAVAKLENCYKDDAIKGVYSNLCKGRRDVIVPVIAPDDEYVSAWMAEPYEPYDRWDDVATEFYSVKGERVRSRAEKMIADELAAYNVPYKYEYPLELMNGRQTKIYRPDFLALNRRTREEFVLEHLGMMDKLGYYNSNLNKIDVMEHNGYLLGVNLLILHETSESPISIPVVRRYIEEYLI